MAEQLGEIIPVEDVQRSPRGRKATYSADMLELLAQLTPDTALALTGLGNVDKDQRSSVSANIRKHFTHVHGDDVKCRIEYSPEGVPQVKFVA